MDEKRRSERRQRGDAAEESACCHLVRAGYEILARNVACRYGELDIVAKRGEVLCFVEVRMRSCAAWGDPSQTIFRSKQRRVVLSAMEYMRVTRLPPLMIRFDVVSVLGRGAGAAVEHIPNAFDAGF